MALNYTNAFAAYGAALVNPRWAYSAIAEDGSLVLSCWNHMLKPASKGVFRYEDIFSRWKTNSRGKSLLQKHLRKAIEADLPVRLVTATAKHTRSIDIGADDASNVPKEFRVRHDLTGRVVELTDWRFAVDFRES